jgi:hypothetical protein
MSFLNRRAMRSLARLIVLMLLFGQSLSAALPCQMPEHKPAMALDDMAGMDCAQKGNPNSCLQQCTGADQSSNHVQVAFADLSQVAVLTVPVAVDRAVASQPPPVCLAHSPDPPPSIRFCSLQL